jgi:hypothetical protein
MHHNAPGAIQGHCGASGILVPSHLPNRSGAKADTARFAHSLRAWNLARAMASRVPAWSCDEPRDPHEQIGHINGL